MSELDPVTLRRELLLQQGINEQLGTLVKQANTTVKLLKDSQMEEAQLRNLLNASLESRSVDVVVSFVRYQIARPNSAWGIQPKSFGHTVIADLCDKLPKWRDLAMETAQKGAEEGGVNFSGADRERIKVRLMQLYLGYLNRAFYYSKKTNDFDSLDRVCDTEPTKDKATSGGASDV